MRYVALDGIYQPLVGVGDVNGVRCDRNVIIDVTMHLPEIGWSACLAKEFVHNAYQPPRAFHSLMRAESLMKRLVQPK